MKATAAEKLKKIAEMTDDEVFANFKTSNMGLMPEEAECRKKTLKDKSESVMSVIVRSFISPFTVILLIVAAIAFCMGFWSASDNFISAGIILAIIIISGIIQSTQNVKTHKTFIKSWRLAKLPVTVKRGGVLLQLPSSDIVEGDIVMLSAGCKVPADLRIIKANDLCVTQAAVTGESAITKKNPDVFNTSENLPLPKYDNLVFTGSAVISGKGEGVVVATGKDTLFGEIPRKRRNAFTKGAGEIAKVVLKFMLFLVPLSLLIIGLTTQSFSQAVMFALSVAVGIVPEMLPMVVSVCLAKGSRTMLKKKTLVKNADTMQGFAGMDVLCVDKTGTLTNSEISLEYYLDSLGFESENTLTLAYLNAYCQDGRNNYIDNAILKFADNPLFCDKLSDLAKRTKKLDEIPFGYDRKYATSLLSNEEKKFIVCKGNVEEIVAKCSFVQCNSEIVPMTADQKHSVDEVVGEMLSDGMKVIAVAQKTVEKSTLVDNDICGMTLVGYLVFFDSPKKSAKEAVKKLKDYSVDVIVLTGDNADVSVSVCKRIGIPYEKILKGAELEALSDEQLKIALKDIKIFAELTPDQKVRIVNLLKTEGHTVGYLGDGINDIPALCTADIAISVDTAQQSAKDVADVLLLEKDLNVLAEGICEGRKILTNVQKYVKITASSNIGNVFALVLASILLPFSPMIAIQLLMLNILYDLLCFTISWDNVDPEELKSSRVWTGKGITRFAVWFGCISTVFDILTFVFLYFVFCPWAVGGSYSSLSPENTVTFIALFQTGWFLESMWSQVLILNILRTRKIPFVQSKPSVPFLCVMLAGVALFTFIPFTSLGNILGFIGVPPLYFAYLAVAVLLYIAVVNGAKCLYVKKFGELF